VPEDQLLNPNQFRPRLEAELGQAMGREVKMGDLKLALTSGSVSAADLAISDDPGFSKASFLTAKSLGVGVDLKELIFSKKLVVTGSEIQQPDIVLIQNAAGVWNVSSLGTKSDPAKPAETQPPSPSSSAPPDLSVKLLKIVDARISLQRGKSKPQALEKVNVSVTDFSPSSSFPFTFTAAVQGGGKVAMDGKAGPIDANDAATTPFTANLKVDKLDMVHAGFVDVGTGFAGLVSITGTVSSSGNKFDTKGDVKAEQLKLAKKGTPAKVPVDFNFALLHDAPEYVIGDMISPFKAALGEVYRDVEARLARAICQRFSLNPDPPPALAKMTKRADRISAFYEATLYAGFGPDEAQSLFGRPEVEQKRIELWLAPMKPEAAQALFLQKFAEFEGAL